METTAQATKDHAAYRRQLPYIAAAFVAGAILVAVLLNRQAGPDEACLLNKLTAQKVCGDDAKQACSVSFMANTQACRAILARP